MSRIRSTTPRPNSRVVTRSMVRGGRRAQMETPPHPTLSPKGEGVPRVTTLYSAAPVVLSSFWGALVEPFPSRCEAVPALAAHDDADCAMLRDMERAKHIASPIAWALGAWLVLRYVPWAKIPVRGLEALIGRGARALGVQITRLMPRATRELLRHPETVAVEALHTGDWRRASRAHARLAAQSFAAAVAMQSPAYGESSTHFDARKNAEYVRAYESVCKAGFLLMMHDAWKNAIVLFDKWARKFLRAGQAREHAALRVFEHLARLHARGYAADVQLQWRLYSEQPNTQTVGEFCSGVWSAAQALGDSGAWAVNIREILANPPPAKVVGKVQPAKDPISARFVGIGEELLSEPEIPVRASATPTWVPPDVDLNAPPNPDSPETKTRPQRPLLSGEERVATPAATQAPEASAKSATAPVEASDRFRMLELD